MKTLCRITLETSRLRLRRPSLTDAPAVMELAGDLRVARPTAVIPHPYTLAHALDWFDSVRDDFVTGSGHTYVIERLDQPGAIGLLRTGGGLSASAGYWIGHPFWGRGYATESLREMLRHGFEDLGLQRIDAWHILENSASGRVMQKAGMQFQGVTPNGCRRGEEVFDKVSYSFTSDDWRHRHSSYSP